MHSPITLRGTLAALAFVCAIAGGAKTIEFDVTADECAYNRIAPNLRQAEIFYSAMNWGCAHHVIQDVLGIERDSTERARAWFLLSAVYYWALDEFGTDPDSMEVVVFSTAKQAFLLDSLYDNPALCQETDFRRWISSARAEARSELQALRLAQEVVTIDTASADTTLPDTGGTPLWKRWWFLTASAAVVGTGVYFITQGGDDPPPEDLPDFPAPPGGKR